MSNVSEILEAVERRYNLPDAYERCIKFMLSGLWLVRDSLPGPAQEAAAAAERYWTKGQGEPSLESMKVELS